MVEGGAGGWECVWCAMAMQPPREEGVRSRPIDEERGSRGRHVSKQDRRKKNLEVSMTHTERDTEREREF